MKNTETTPPTGSETSNTQRHADAPTTRREWWPGLDGLRGYLFLIVFTVHLPFTYIPAIKPIHGGYIVMEVFFVLSGFLITTILLREIESKQSINLKNFYIRRAARLLPVVVLFAVAVYALTYVDPYLKSRGADYRRHSLASLSYLYNWIGIYSFNRESGAPGYVAHLWSLSVEEQFYVVWPTVLFFSYRRMKQRTAATLRDVANTMIPWLIGAIVLSNMIRTGIGYAFENSSSYHRANWGTDARASGMLIGSLFAIIRLGRPELYAKFRRHLPWLCWVALAIWIPGLWLYPQETNPFPFAGGFLLSELCSLVFVLALIERSVPAFNWVCELKPMQWVGRVSYAAYVIHFLMIGRFTAYTRIRHPYPVLLFATLALSGLSLRFIERPILNRYGRRPTPPSAPHLPT